MDYGHPCRVGFELEIILGDLDDDRFDTDEPMDVASPRYCQAVARRLRDLTAGPWRAPKAAPRSPGFYVLSEYDVDPLDWPRGLMAGVELITPPLSIAEAERVGRELIGAIWTLGVR